MKNQHSIRLIETIKSPFFSTRSLKKTDGSPCEYRKKEKAKQTEYIKKECVKTQDASITNLEGISFLGLGFSRTLRAFQSVYVLTNI